MKLIITLDYQSAFLQGKEIPSPIATIDVDPAKLSQRQRELIGPRLKHRPGSINELFVCKLLYCPEDGESQLIVVKEPTIESVLDKIQDEERRLEPFRQAAKEAEQREQARIDAERRQAERARRANELLDRLYPSPALPAAR